MKFYQRYCAAFALARTNTTFLSLQVDDDQVAYAIALGTADGSGPGAGGLREPRSLPDVSRKITAALHGEPSK